MAKFVLAPFDQQSAPPISIESELTLTGESIFISYKLTGDLGAIDFGEGLPKHARVMKLWEKTCFELFIKNQQDSYIEFNFSPDFEWNCFYFEKKGNELAEYKRMELVTFDILFSNEVIHVIVELQKSMFPDHFFDGALSAGISSVIKEKNGKLSYWALSHENQRPNFHNFNSFKYKF